MVAAELALLTQSAVRRPLEMQDSLVQVHKFAVAVYRMLLRSTCGTLRKDSAYVAIFSGVWTHAAGLLFNQP